MKNCKLLFIFIFFTSCRIDKSKIVINVKKELRSTSDVKSVSNIELINRQFILKGNGLSNVLSVKIEEGSTQTPLSIESASSTKIILNSIGNVSFAAGRVFNFILSDAFGSSTYSVNFSLCDSTLNGKAFNCSVIAHDKDVLSFDANSNKWVPRSISGLNYIGTFSAAGAVDPGAGSVSDYYIISVAGTINSVVYSVGDWIVYNGIAWEKISNASGITSVFGRTGVITATKGDYNLNKLSDVDFTTTPPVIGNILTFSAGGKWIPGVAASVSETDPTVKAFAQANLPTCAASEVLKANGTSFSCVTNGGIASTITAPTLTNSAIASGDSLQTVAGKLQAQFNNILSVVLTGISTATNAVITGADTIISAFGKLQAQISAHSTAIASKADTLNGSQTITASTINAITVTGLNAPILGADATNKTYVDSKTSQWTNSAPDIYFNAGKVAIGKTSPGAALDVQGTIKSNLVLVATPTTGIDWALGNILYTTVSCAGAIWNVTNLIPGTTYTFVVQGNTHTGSCSFSDAVSTFKYQPSNTTPTNGKDVIYSLTKVGTVVYVAWIDAW